MKDGAISINNQIWNGFSYLKPFLFLVFTMKKLIHYEMRKIWIGKWKILPIVIVCIIMLWMIVIGGAKYGPVRAILDGRATRANEETRPYWGQVVTQELHDLAVEKALSYGAEIVSSAFGDQTFTEYSPQPMAKQFGTDSMEYELCSVWTDIANQPLYETELADMAELEQMLTEQYKQGLRSEGTMRTFYRTKNFAPWRVLPRYSAWDYWMNLVDYSSLLSGAAALLLILIFLSDLFSVEKGGGMGSISAATAGRTKWIVAKLLAAMLTGALLMLILYGVLLLFYGLVFGFQGWNLNPMWYRARGYTQGTVYRDVPALAMAGIRMGVLALCGVFFGALSAAISAVTKRATFTAGFSLLMMGLMESLLFLSLELRKNPAVQLWIDNHDCILIFAVLSTPMRMFFNVELLSGQFYIPLSDFQIELNYNIFCCPDLLAAFAVPILVGIGLSAWVCMWTGREGY